MRLIYVRQKITDIILQNLRIKQYELITDHNEWPKSYAIIRRFLFQFVGMISLDKNYREVINLLFVLLSSVFRFT